MKIGLAVNDEPVSHSGSFNAGVSFAFFMARSKIFGPISCIALGRSSPIMIDEFLSA